MSNKLIEKAQSAYSKRFQELEFIKKEECLSLAVSLFGEEHSDCFEYLTGGLLKIGDDCLFLKVDGNSFNAYFKNGRELVFGELVVHDLITLGKALEETKKYDP